MKQYRLEISFTNNVSTRSLNEANALKLSTIGVHNGRGWVGRSKGAYPLRCLKIQQGLEFRTFEYRIHSKTEPFKIRFSKGSVFECLKPFEQTIQKPNFFTIQKLNFSKWPLQPRLLFKKKKLFMKRSMLTAIRNPNKMVAILFGFRMVKKTKWPHQPRSFYVYIKIIFIYKTTQAS